MIPGGAMEEFLKAHRNADTDTEPSSIHHTLGKGPNQAAPGNHKHSDYAPVDHEVKGIAPDGNTPPSFFPVGINTYNITSSGPGNWPVTNGTLLVVKAHTSLRTMQIILPYNGYIMFLRTEGASDGWTTWYRNLNGANNGNIADLNALPSSYLQGVSLASVLNGTTVNSPITNGTLLTVRSIGNRTYQQLVEWGTGNTRIRHENGTDVWGSWIELVSGRAFGNSPPLASALPSTYPLGVSIHHSRTADPGSWPTDYGTILTNKPISSGRTVQTFTDYTGEVWTRGEVSGDAWTVWRKTGSGSCFRHRGMSLDMSPASATVTVVNLDTEVDTDGNSGLTWDTVNKRFNCDVAGIYSINAAVAWPSVTSGVRYIYVMKNGAQNSRIGGPLPSGATTSMGLEDTVRLAVGDYVDFRVYQNQGAVTIPGSTSANYMKITRIK